MKKRIAFVSFMLLLACAGNALAENCYNCIFQGTYESGVFGCSNNGGQQPGTVSCYNTATYCNTFGQGCGSGGSCDIEYPETCPQEKT